MSYAALLAAHGLTRWAVLAAAAWAVARSWQGWVGGGPWGRRDTLAGLAFSTALNVQAVLGVILYLNSPHIRPVFAAPAYAVSGAVPFFFAVAHPAAMLTAAVAAQAAYSLAKRVGDDRVRFRRAAIGYGGAAALLAAAMPWPGLPYGRALPASAWPWGR